MGRPIDSQRRKLYTAEGCLKRLATQKKFDTIDEVKAHVRKMMDTAWWKKNFPKHYSLEIENGAGKRSAKGGPRGNGIWMTLPRWARNEYVILHEMAHGVCSREYAAHGREYAAILLKLVTRFMGKAHGKELREAFAKHKVKYKPKRTLSPEQRALAVARIKSFQKTKDVFQAANKKDSEGLE